MAKNYWIQAAENRAMEQERLLKSLTNECRDVEGSKPRVKVILVDGQACIQGKERVRQTKDYLDSYKALQESMNSIKLVSENLKVIL